METMIEPQGCAQCKIQPTVKVSSNGNVVLACEKHPGHMAMGADLLQAIEHWNIYIHFIGLELAA